MRDFVSGTVRDSLRRAVAISDSIFDRIYPLAEQLRSRTQWTPVAVGLRAAALLAPRPGMRVLDVGSGTGKLCCVSAFVTDARFYGIEHDADLVATAVDSADLLGISDRVQFRAADMAAVDWTDFDSLYFFNPFESALFDGGADLTRAWHRFDHEVSFVEDRLASMPRGTRVVTFHGFGGEMPSTYRLVTTERFEAGELALWIHEPARTATTMRVLA